MRRAMFLLTMTGLMLLGVAPTALAAEPTAPQAPRRLRLFLDCPESTCDFDFLKRELAWVDWVRDRTDADVSVLLTTRETGGGGTEGIFYVTRPRGGGPRADTLVVFSPSTDSEDDSRRLVLRSLGALLMRDAATRSGAERLSITFAEPKVSAGPAAGETRDPWNHWVYKLSTSGYMNGEKSYRSLSLYSSVAASRATESDRLGLGVSQSYSENEFQLGGGSRFTSITRSWSARQLWAHSLTPRWSAGVSTGAYSSSFSNTHLALRVGPAIEYDIYPYSESSRRSVTLGYQLNTSHSRYESETLYGKTSEVLVSQEVDLAVALRQPWGSVDMTTTLNQYLHDTTKYRVTTSGNVDLKLWKGFSLSGYGYVSRIRDQLSLPRGDASDSEVLARQRQLATAYQYYASFGVSYRFGSIFDSVVNQRLLTTFGTI